MKESSKSGSGTASKSGTALSRTETPKSAATKVSSQYSETKQRDGSSEPELIDPTKGLDKTQFLLLFMLEPIYQFLQEDNSDNVFIFPISFIDIVSVIILLFTHYIDLFL